MKAVIIKDLLGFGQIGDSVEILGNRIVQRDLGPGIFCNRPTLILVKNKFDIKQSIPAKALKTLDNGMTDCGNCGEIHHEDFNCDTK